jgi:sulfur carrier protein
MKVTLNGELVVLGDDATVAGAVERAGVNGNARGVAVAVDGDVVPRGEWAETELHEGQSVEVVAAIQGG